MSKFRYSGKDKAFARKMGFDDGGSVGGDGGDSSGGFSWSGGAGTANMTPAEAANANLADLQAAKAKGGGGRMSGGTTPGSPVQNNAPPDDPPCQSVGGNGIYCPGIGS